MLILHKIIKFKSFERKLLLKNKLFTVRRYGVPESVRLRHVFSSASYERIIKEYTENIHKEMLS